MHFYSWVVVARSRAYDRRGNVREDELQRAVSGAFRGREAFGIGGRFAGKIQGKEPFEDFWGKHADDAYYAAVRRFSTAAHNVAPVGTLIDVLKDDVIIDSGYSDDRFRYEAERHPSFVVLPKNGTLPRRWLPLLHDRSDRRESALWELWELEPDRWKQEMDRQRHLSHGAMGTSDRAAVEAWMAYLWGELTPYAEGFVAVGCDVKD